MRAGRPRDLRLRVGVGREKGVVRVRTGHQDAYAGQVEAVEQREVPPLGHQDPAVGVHDVAGQFGAAPCRVDARNGHAREGGGAQPQGIFGGVVEQHPDVRLAPAGQQIGEQRGPGRRARRHLMVGQLPAREAQAGAVVAPPRPYEFRDRVPGALHGRAP